MMTPLFLLEPIEGPLTSLLEWFHNTVGLSWAWSIVALTILVRVVLLPLTVRQIHSMQSMQVHMPEMKALQQRYKDDKQKRNEELMKFYKENKINPAASCLPIAFLFVVLNFPSGLVLYWVTTNLWTVGQGLITRRLMPKKSTEPVKRSSRTPAKEEAPVAKVEPAAKPAQPSGPPRRVKRKKKRAKR